MDFAFMENYKSKNYKKEKFDKKLAVRSTKTTQ